MKICCTLKKPPQKQRQTWRGKCLAKKQSSLATLVFIAPLLLSSPCFATELKAEVAYLIEQAEPGTPDTKGWSADISSSLREMRIPQTAENVCAVVAVIDQESGFFANPKVPGLGKRSEVAIKRKLADWSILGTGLEDFLTNYPVGKTSFMKCIRTAKTERDLDITYREATHALAEQAGLDDLVSLQLVTDILESQNDIRTIGSMQVSVDFALQSLVKNNTPHSIDEVYQVRDRLYSRKGGVYFGALQLLGYESGYDDIIYRFADYNAGRFSSRNSAYQFMVSKLGKIDLVLDGDLLSYNKRGNPISASSSSEQAVLTTLKKHGFKFNASAVRQDLLMEKSRAFDKTTTARLLRKLYRERFGVAAPSAVMPNIQLSSIKIDRQMTTADFARLVMKRYVRCMARANGGS